MKKFFILFILILSVIALSGKVYIYPNFGYLVDSKDVRGSGFSMEIPQGVSSDLSGFSFIGLPEKTVISIEKGDSYASLLEKYEGKLVLVRYENGLEEYFTLLDADGPVLRDSKGNIHFSVSGKIIFLNSTYSPSDKLKAEFPSYINEETVYSLKLSSAGWSAKYIINLDEKSSHMDGSFLIYSEYDLSENEVQIVNADLGRNVQALQKNVMMDYAEGYASDQSYQSSNLWSYAIDVPLTEKYNSVSFISKNIQSGKHYVFRPGWSTDYFQGVDIDLRIGTLDFDLPAGSVEVYEDGFLMGTTYIQTIPQGQEETILKKIASSLEIKGKKESYVQNKLYTNIYSISNFSEESAVVTIEDQIGNAYDLQVKIDGRIINNFELSNPNIFSISLGLSEGTTRKVEIQYRTK